MEKEFFSFYDIPINKKLGYIHDNKEGKNKKGE